MNEISDMRFAHSNGHTDLCFDDIGRYIFTCGADGEMRIWHGFEDDDPATHSIGEYCHCITFKKGRLFVATNNNSIQAYTFPEVNPDGIITRFTSPVNSMCCSNDGKLLIAGAGDFMIKAVDTTDSTQNIFEGHEAPILSVAIDPQAYYVASSSCDGTVRIWNILDQTCVKTMHLFPKSNDFCLSKTLCRPSWHPSNGKYLAVPVDKKVHLYERETWECDTTLTDNINEILSIVTFSPCGNYLAASSVDGQVFVWDLKSFSCIQKYKHEKSTTICSLVWNPSDKREIAICDTQGQLGIIENILVANDVKADSEKQFIRPLAESNYDFPALCLSEDKSETEDDELPFTHKHKKSKTIDDDDLEIDIGAIKASLEPKIFGTQDDESSTQFSPIKSALSAPTVPSTTPVASVPKTTTLQQAFQPASTPLHWEHRFMVWNTVGLVRCYNTEEENSIDVEFHDTSMHHAIHLTNSLNHSMAALSSEALLLACSKEDSTSSQIVCMNFDTWDSNKEWSIEMTDDEDVEALALGSGWTAAATNKRLIRLYTVGGVQLETFCLPGPVVCMSGQEKTLVIAYHQGYGIPGDQNLAMMVVKMKFQKQSFTSPVSVPLSPKSVLSWLGFTDEGTICTVDSLGIIRLMDLSNGCQWSPIANTKAHAKGKSDHYFVVGLSEIQQQIRCIPCKGSRFPPTLPRPAVTVLPLQFPFCELHTDKGKYEEEYWRLTHLHRLLSYLSKNEFDVESELENADKKRTDCLLRMFALATRADREFRALEVAELMPSQRVVQGAIRYATQRQHLALAERLGQVAQEKLQQEMETIIEKDDIMENPDWNEMQRTNISQAIKLHSGQNNDIVLQPKSLSLSRSSRQEVNDTENTENEIIPNHCEAEAHNNEEYDGKDADISTSSENMQKNPFKAAVQRRMSGVGIDGILETGVKKLTSKNSDDISQKKSKATKQMKLFAPKENVQSSEEKPSTNRNGFKSFLEENKIALAEENPELDEEDIVKLAIKKFKQLSTEEKKKWTLKKRKQQEEPVQKNVAKKSKSSPESNQKEVSSITSSKLTKFLFSKEQF